MARLRQSRQTIGQVERMKETKLRTLVQGSLAVSRGIGDSHFKQWVIPEPETQTIQIGSKSEFVILASYGLWDKVTNQEAVSTVHPFFTENHKTGSIASSCKKLVELSILKGIGG